MTRSTVVLTVSLTVLFALVGLAFLYIDLTGHKSFHYEITKNGVPYGTVVIDRYITESKIVYKSREATPFSEGYPSSSSALYLDRASKTPSKYIKDQYGARGQRAITSLVQKGDLSDYVFLENPRFLHVENFSTGEKTMVYSPEDLMLVTALMERYSFWEKGTQYFEVMMPVPAPLPPLRDKLWVRYKEEDYIPVMDRKIEAERYILGSRGLNEVKVSVSRHGHRVLGMECAYNGTVYTLESIREGASKFSSFSLGSVPFLRNIIRGLPADERFGAEQNELLKGDSPDKVLIPGRIDPKEVFFESGNAVLCGEIWKPEGNEQSGAVLLVPGEGPRKTGERLLTVYLASFLARYGYLVLSFDPPGLGKSQGSFYESDDTIKARNIESAIKFLCTESSASGPLLMISRGNSSVPAMKVAENNSSVSACVVINPFSGMRNDLKGRLNVEEQLGKFPGILDPSAFDKGFLSKVSDVVENHFSTVENSSSEMFYFSGLGLPIKTYRDYLSRTPYKVIISMKKPLLVMMGNGDPGTGKEAVGALRTAVFSENDMSAVAVLNSSARNGGTIELVGNKWEYVPNTEYFSILKSWIDRVLARNADENVILQAD